MTHVLFGAMGQAKSKRTSREKMALIISGMKVHMGVPRVQSIFYDKTICVTYYHVTDNPKINNVKQHTSLSQNFCGWELNLAYLDKGISLDVAKLSNRLLSHLMA